jgi:hypothetical protein
LKGAPISAAWKAFWSILLDLKAVPRISMRTDRCY